MISENGPIRWKYSKNSELHFSSLIPFRLPIAPSMKLYCVYGHGLETEVSNPRNCNAGEGMMLQQPC